MIVECPANTRLQDYLLKNDIHILTPCGGRGNCAKCKVRILKGEAKINTMDQIWFSQKELDEGYRLGCQVFAKEPLAIEIYEKRGRSNEKNTNEHACSVYGSIGRMCTDECTDAVKGTGSSI